MKSNACAFLLKCLACRGEIGSMFALWCIWYGNLEGWAKKKEKRNTQICGNESLCIHKYYNDADVDACLG